MVLNGSRLPADVLSLPPSKVVNDKSETLIDKYHLTPRELQILHLISKALSTKQIAKVLYISDQTVSVHRKNIMRKLEVNNTVALVRIALENQIAG